MRARVLILVVVLALSGCTGTSGYDDSGRTVVAEDQFYSTAFDASARVTLTISVEVHDGPSIDVIVVDVINFQQFRDGNEFVAFTSCGGVAAQGFQRSCSLDAGTYHVILDNTDAGNTSPPFNAVNDGADVSWTIEAS